MDEIGTEIESVEKAGDELRTEEESMPVGAPNHPPWAVSQASYLTYMLIPGIFLTVTLLGGLRIAAADNAFLFLKPALVALVFSALTVALYFRFGMIEIGGWIAEDQPLLRNIANITVLITLFTSTAQIYNALLPEQGLAFWVVGFCFFWTIWNNLFAEFDPRRLLRSMIALFGLAFVVKYLVLANITSTQTGRWWQRLLENPGKEAFTWALDLPKYSDGTGYVQFFTLAMYLLGLVLMPRKTD